MSNTLTAAPVGLEDKVFIVKGALRELMQELENKGYKNLYIDGSLTIQNFLKEDLIDELIITTIPVLLGGGIPLFGLNDESLKFRHYKSKQFLNCIVQKHFIRQR